MHLFQSPVGGKCLLSDRELSFFRSQVNLGLSVDSVANPFHTHVKRPNGTVRGVFSPCNLFCWPLWPTTFFDPYVCHTKKISHLPLCIILLNYIEQLELIFAAVYRLDGAIRHPVLVQRKVNNTVFAIKMILLGSVEEFFVELDGMFNICRERGSGTVYTTLKKVDDKCSGSRESTKGKAVEMNGDKRTVERREGWLARAKTSVKKTRKISVLVSMTMFRIQGCTVCSAGFERFLEPPQ